MNKTKKKQNNYNDAVINELKSRHGYTRDYILKSIRGERVGTIPTKLKDEYHQLDRAAKAAIRSKVNEL